MNNDTDIQQYTSPSVTPNAPEGISPEDRTAIEQKSKTLVDQVLQNPDDQKLVEGLSNLGTKAQQISGQSIQFLQTRVGTMLNQLDKDDAQIPKGLVDLRLSLDEINPYALAKPSLLKRMFGWIPIIGKMNPERILKIIASRYETIQQQIERIMDNLYSGKDALLRDNVELEQLAAQVKGQLLDVQKNAFLGENVMQQLQITSDQPQQDPATRQKLLDLMSDVSTRVQDLRTIEQADLQFLVSIAMTIGNNRRLSQTIDRTVNVTRNVITIGLSIQLALSRQKEILKATRDTQEYAADVLAANAGAIRKQGAEIGEMYKNPVLALDKVKAAYTDLMAAMDEADKAKKEGITAAQNGIAQLSDMSSKLTQRAYGMRSQQNAPETPSIEA